MPPFIPKPYNTYLIQIKITKNKYIDILGILLFKHIVMNSLNKKVDDLFIGYI